MAGSGGGVQGDQGRYDADHAVLLCEHGRVCLCAIDVCVCESMKKYCMEHDARMKRSSRCSEPRPWWYRFRQVVPRLRLTLSSPKLRRASSCVRACVCAPGIETSKRGEVWRLRSVQQRLISAIQSYSQSTGRIFKFSHATQTETDRHPAAHETRRISSWTPLRSVHIAIKPWQTWASRRHRGQPHRRQGNRHWYCRRDERQSMQSW